MSNSFEEKLPKEQTADFCDRWNIIEFALLSLILGNDFCPDSDVDVLVTLSQVLGKLYSAVTTGYYS
jgi:predicted nucleotidyltransferase